MIAYLPSWPYGFSYARISSFQRDKTLEIKENSVAGIEFTYTIVFVFSGGR